jgi:hypothetical protein
MSHEHLQNLKRSIFSFLHISGPAAPVGPSCYTDSEKELMKQQLKVGNAEMRAAVQMRGYALHPKIAARKRVPA